MTRALHSFSSRFLTRCTFCSCCSPCFFRRRATSLRQHAASKGIKAKSNSAPETIGATLQNQTKKDAKTYTMHTNISTTHAPPTPRMNGNCSLMVCSVFELTMLSTSSAFLLTCSISDILDDCSLYFPRIIILFSNKNQTRGSHYETPTTEKILPSSKHSKNEKKKQIDRLGNGRTRFPCANKQRQRQSPGIEKESPEPQIRWKT